jgi:general secretion pathway protein A
VARCHLEALSKADLFLYVNHRLGVARGKSELFTQDALNSLYIYSGGIPRLINIICDRALLGAFVLQKEVVDRATLAKAAGEVLGPQLSGTGRRRKAVLTAVILICAGLGLLYYFFK